MTLQLFSIEHAPAALPYWQTIMDDLACPPARRVASVLGIGVRTVYRYNKTGAAPRVVLLALFWLTRWGRSAVDANATNDALLAVSYVRSLCDRIAELEHQVGHLQRLGGYGSANLPLKDGLGYEARSLAANWGVAARPPGATPLHLDSSGDSRRSVEAPQGSRALGDIGSATSAPSIDGRPGIDDLAAGERLAAAGGQGSEPRPRNAGGRRRRPA